MTDRVLGDNQHIAGKYPATEFWIDEAIWGHRLYDEPSAQLIFLEFLNVVFAIARNAEPFVTGGTIGDALHLTLSYQESLLLRTILFNNPTLRAPMKAGKPDWEAWDIQRRGLFDACLGYGAPVKKYGIDSAEAFRYLEHHFPSYASYVALVNILLMDAVEGKSNKRWTSKFLFPFAPEALFADLNDKNLSSDRRFFARSGELAYLMLARSGRGKKIWRGLRSIVFQPAQHSERWIQAIRSLMHDKELEGDGDNDGQLIGYLPFAKHKTFEAFGDDFLSLLGVGLPGYDVLPHLGLLTTFYLMHYLLTIATEDLGRPQVQGRLSSVKYVLEIMSDRPDMVRRASRDAYQQNNELPRRRLEAALDHIKESQAVARALETDDGDSLKRALGKWWQKVDWKPNRQKPCDVWERFKKAVLDRHRQHLGNVHHEYARSCGLASRRRTNAYRYTLSDQFLRTLVLANIRERMEYDEFVDRLYERYGMIIAKRHAETCKLAGDVTDFDSNDRRLQIRLTRLGMLHRLSDACAYVVNRHIDRGVG